MRSQQNDPGRLFFPHLGHVMNLSISLRPKGSISFIQARFRVILVLCLPSHVNNLLNELQTDHATELWNIIHKLSVLICHESQLRHQCELKLCCILSCNKSCDVCVVEREGVRTVLRVKRTVDVKDQYFQLSQTMN